MEWYCPSCGTYTDKNKALDKDSELLISPGELPFICPECGTVFVIQIEFIANDVFPTERN